VKYYVSNIYLTFYCTCQKEEFTQGSSLSSCCLCLQPKQRVKPKAKEEASAPPEKINPEREEAAGQVWVADCDGEIAGCVCRESEVRPGIRRICRVVVGSWYRREGLGRLLVHSLERREREAGARRVYAHVPFPSKLGEVFFRKLGYRPLGERTGEEGEEEEEDEEVKVETAERGFLGFPLTKVFYKDL